MARRTRSVTGIAGAVVAILTSTSNAEATQSPAVGGNDVRFVPTATVRSTSGLLDFYQHMDSSRGVLMPFETRATVDTGEAIRAELKEYKRRNLPCLNEAANAAVQVFLGFPDGELGAIEDIVEAAAARLALCSCQKVLSDFTDKGGVLLSTRLVASGRNPVEAFHVLRFVDGRLAPQCRTGNRLAFTFTESQVIYICSWQFRAWSISPRNRIRTELIVIHEFLHTLGLGENPPTSLAITNRVAARCAN